MGRKSQTDMHADALAYLVKNLEALPQAEVQSRVRQVAKQAIADAEAAENAGKAQEAAMLYRLAAQAYRQLAELSSGDQRVSERATAKFWEDRAELVLKYAERLPSSNANSQASSKQKATIHTPKPTPIPAKTSFERNQTRKRQWPTAPGQQGADSFKRPPKRAGFDQADDDRSSVPRPKT